MAGYGRFTPVYGADPTQLTRLNDMLRYLFNKVQGGLTIREMGNEIVLSGADGSVGAVIGVTRGDRQIAVGAGREFHSIQAAINSLPGIINHDVTITVYAETYAEDVMIKGFTGRGTLAIRADSTFSVSSFTVSSCSLGDEIGVGLIIDGGDALSHSVCTSAVAPGFTITASSGVHVAHFTIAESASAEGVAVFNSFATLADITISNRGVGVAAYNGANVHLSGLSGSENRTGVAAHYGGIITKYYEEAMPSGTVENENTQYGGLIVNYRGCVLPGGDGWVYAAETWSFASAGSFTVPGDRRGKYRKGDKIRLLQGGNVKFFAVTGVSYASQKTTVSVTGGSDYALSDSVIYGNYLSRAASPHGYPDWFNWTPAFTGFSSAPAGGIYRFRIEGRQCICVFRQPNAGISNAATFTMSAPVRSAGIAGMTWGACVPIADNGVRQSVPGVIEIGADSQTVHVGRNAALEPWTASGGKRVVFATLIYEY